MKTKLILALIISLNVVTQLNAQQANRKTTSNWQGAIVTPGGDLGMILKIVATDSRVFTKMDVPAQRAKDIPATRTNIINDSLMVDFAIMRASYKGLFINDSTINGVWEQGGTKFPLMLSKTTQTAVTIKHPQEPKKPYAYNEEEIVFENKTANVKLAGTFTWPKNKTNCPVAILITGSGPQNRDEELLGQKPFLVLADYLTNNGIAVLRYDDRGIATSTGDFKSATSLDFAGDAEAAFAYLKTRKEINKKKIGLIGHSEGGLVAEIVASRTKDVGFVILMAGPGLKGSDLMALQSAAIIGKTMSEEDVAHLTIINKNIYTMAIDNKPGVADSIKAILEEMGMPEKSADKQIETILSPWYRGFLASDPSKYLSKITCPVLALNGTKDVQVVCKENLQGINKGLARNKQHTTKAYEGLNHLFQHCKTGMMDEYEQSEETISPEVLKDMGDWIGQLK